MRVSDELFELIKSLSVGENRVVLGALSSRKKELYRIYQQLEVHDHEAIKTLFPHNSTQHIASTKRQLYEDILEALWRGGTRNAQRRLHDYQGACELLMRKGLYDLALRRANLLIEESAKFEAIQELSVGLEMKRRILEIIPVSDEHLQRDQALAQLVVDGLAERGEVERAYSLAMAARREPLEHRLIAIQKALASLPPPDAIQLGRSKIRRHRAAYILHRLTGAHDACAKDCEAVLEVLAAQPALLEDVTVRDEYFTNLHFQIAYLTSKKQLEEAEKAIRKFELGVKKWVGNIASDPIIYSRLTYSKLAVLLYRRKFDVVKKVVSEVVAHAGTGSSELLLGQKPRWLTIVLQSLFLLKDFRGVRMLVNAIKPNVPQHHQDHSFYTSVGLYYLFSLLEESDEHLEKSIESIQRWYEEIGCTGAFQDTLLSFFREASKEVHERVSTSLLAKLEDALAGHLSNPLTWLNDELFPISKWIKSKREGLDLKTLMFC